MNTEKSIETLKFVADSMHELDRVSRLAMYAAFAEIEAHLEREAEGLNLGGKVREKLVDYRTALETLCGLSDGQELSEDMQTHVMRAAISVIRSDLRVEERIPS